jgi:malate synthase
MTQRIQHHGLQVAAILSQFIETEALPGTGLAPDAFWQGFAKFVDELAPQNRELLREGDRLQTQLDTWHHEHPGAIQDAVAYRRFLQGIGYLQTPPAKVQATTSNVDSEIAVQAGPQLVVPMSNPRYALNAANARWGSLYDALYGTDAIPFDASEKTQSYNPARGKAVIARARAFLDSAAALSQGSHRDATGYAVKEGQLHVRFAQGDATLKEPEKFVSYQGDPASPSTILLRNNGLHFEI